MIKTRLFTAKDVQEIPPSPALQLTPAPTEPDREPVLILVIGSAKGIDKIVHALYKCRFAEVKEWSKLLPAFTPGKLMRSLIRHVLVD
ncbi:peptide ABC transporter substrate-binding protein [Microseira sp. BLCC-F43]|uniref:peptide ABC transporter substrate-binding protein n=1 Tax=Microseira sp. BLCC-F43 TaxID=3153602 RepID=UPI0035B95492